MAGRADVVSTVAERMRDLSRRQVAEAVDAVFATIEDLLTEGERVQITSFGSFSVAEREAREGRNPATGQTIRIPRRRNVKFKPARELREKLGSG